MGIKRRVVAISLVLIAVILFSAFTVAQLLTDIDLKDYTSQCQRIFDDAKKQFEQMRNVTLPANVALHVITKQDAVNMWGTPSAQADLTYILRQEKVYKTLFLMAENQSLYEATVEWTANWGAATVGKTDIYVIKENFNPFDKNAEGTFIHELTHVWQPSLPYPKTFDEDKAHASVVEGDASFMGDYYKNMTNALSSPTPLVVTVNDFPVFLINSPSFENIHPIPQTVWDLNFFPYEYGSKWVSAVYDNGGFATVNRAYQQGYIPSTSSEILHPNLYFENITAEVVQSPRIGDDGWTLTQASQGHDSNTYGEYFIQVMLQNHINKTEAQRAAAGWRGDNFTYYERGNDFLFSWRVKWNTSCDASEFYVSFHNMANSAGATDLGSCNWNFKGRYLSIYWDQDTNSTLIAGSNVQSATSESFFS